LLRHFDTVWFVDFEFYQPDGELPRPLCMVARELRTGRTIRFGEGELAAMDGSPFPVGPRTLFVAYYASAELLCFLSLGWPLPVRILDLCVEFRWLTNGITAPNGRKLLGALASFGLPSILAAEKSEMQELAMRGGRYSAVEMAQLIKYCETDVVALDQLFSKMLPYLDLPRALIRGRSMAAAAHMEAIGIPIDVPLHQQLTAVWEPLKNHVIEQVNVEFGVFVPKRGGSGASYAFSADAFGNWLARFGIPWPVLESGRLNLQEQTFDLMAACYPQLEPLKQARQLLSKLRQLQIPVGTDGRNRTLLAAFGSVTGRYQPSTAKFPFFASRWLRGLIKPRPGRAIAYIDYAQQEFGIAAALSGDLAMQEAYRSGDPYLNFAIQAGAAPPDATKKSHAAIRERFKKCALAVQYMMGEVSLAANIGGIPLQARQLLSLHRRTFPAYWRWSQGAVNHAMLTDRLHTVLGWQIHVTSETNPRTLANFPMQANGAEMLRLACCLATERGIRVCAPVHDALLIEAPIDQIDAAVEECRQAMAEASKIILDGFEIFTDVKIVRYPERYMDPGGVAIWEMVMRFLEQSKTAQ